MFKRFLSKKVVRNYAMPAIVVITGACVLVIEVVATRLLSPYYGNTIFSYSSIIGIVLAALSLGYYIGGHLADRRPSAKLFFGIIVAGGLSTLILHILCITLLPELSRIFSITLGPLVSSLVLFLLPAGLLGMLSPFAITLQQRLTPEKGIGSITGEMFFWSTLGSIIGSLGTGFILVPWFGSDAIIIGVGLLLVIMGLVGLGMLGGLNFKKGNRALIIAGVMLAVVSVGFTNATADNNNLYEKDGLYEKISIYDGTYKGKPARFFKQDKSSSGAMYIGSDELVYDYTKYYAIYKLTNPDVREALVIGGGVYSIPKALLKDLPQATVTVSEIEPSLPQLAEQYFDTPKTPRLQHTTQDGRRLLAYDNKSYDMIFSDVYYSLYSIPSHFTTEEFFHIARQRLTQDGIFIANMIGSTEPAKQSFILSEMRTFQSAFPNSYFFATREPGSNQVQNIMFVGLKSDMPLDLDSPQVRDDPNEIIAKLRDHRISTADYDLSLYPKLTDNYAPIERLMMPLLAKSGTQVPKASGLIMLDTIKQQLTFGPRHPSAPGHKQVQDYIADQAGKISKNVQRQSWQQTDPQTGQVHDLTNIIVRLNPKAERRLVVGSHYDTKYTANLDMTDTAQPVPGANDGASGVAVLLETARTLAASKAPDIGVDFVFFDGEEGFERADIDSNGWAPLGSQYFAANLKDLYPNRKPDSGVIIDMVCKQGLRLKREASSLQAAAPQTNRFWQIGEQTAPYIFVDQQQAGILDDHTSLNKVGIPTFNVIDLDYDAWHTRQDTLDKCSSRSLEAVTKTLTTYIRQY